MATIQTRTAKSGVETYRVGYYLDGKLKWTQTLSDLAGAKNIKKIIETQGHEIALQILEAQDASDALTLADWFPKHLAIVSINATEGTLDDYQKVAARSFLPRLGELPLDMITRQDVIDFIAWYKQQPNQRTVDARKKAQREGRPLPELKYLKPKSVRIAHGLLSSTLQTAVEGGHLDRNPAKGVPVPKDDTEEEKEIFSRDEWGLFYEAMQDYYKPLVAFMLVTGCRIGEATAVQVRDLNVATNTVSVIRAWKKGKGRSRVLGSPKSRRSRRFVKLPDWAVEIFKQAAAGKKRDDMLFPSPTGKRIDSSNFGSRQWSRALEKAGIDKHLTPHSLRHTYASWLLMAGVPPQTVQHILGHESLQTTSEVYGHLLLDAQDQAVEALGWEPPRAIAA